MGKTLVTVGCPKEWNPDPVNWAPEPPELNVTTKSKFVPVLDEFKMMTKLVEFRSKHEDAAILPTMAAQLPPSALVMKLRPKTVMELERYPAKGEKDEETGFAITVKAEELVAKLTDVGLLMFS